MQRLLRCAAHTLAFDQPQVMGVLNITPDSFSDGGRWWSGSQIDLSAVYGATVRMIEQGATVIDVGGESTRPGAAPVSVAQELERVMPVLDKICQLNTIVSLDTRHAEVARQGIDSGVSLINDVSGGEDPAMLELIAATNVGYAVMHMQGTPDVMQQQPRYRQVVLDVADYLRHRYQACLAAGIDAARLMFDPGFGFGKTVQHNLQLLAGLQQLRVDQRPLLVGLSRKSMLGKITGRDVGERLSASLAAAMLALQSGADMLRVHDVAETVDAVKVWQAAQDIDGDQL